ncbi:MAG: BtpA/SgcQ family protein [Nitrospinota bacterium]
MNLKDLFGVDRPLIGMVHLGPLPGSPLYRGNWEETLKNALADARALAEGGMDGFIIENFNDMPYFPNRVPPVTVAAMTEAGHRVSGLNLPFGVNVLRNDALAALAVAYATGASFIRINVFVGARLTDQGLLEATAYAIQRERKRFLPTLAIFADVGVKHSSSLGSSNISNEASDAASRGLADALIVSGSETGHATSFDDLRVVKKAVRSLPVLLGSGVKLETSRELCAAADGVIVGSGIKRRGRVQEPVDIDRVKALVRTLRP